MGNNKDKRPDNKVHGANMGPTWDQPGSSRPQIGPRLAPWTLLSGQDWHAWDAYLWRIPGGSHIYKAPEAYQSLLPISLSWIYLTEKPQGIPRITRSVVKVSNNSNIRRRASNYWILSKKSFLLTTNAAFSTRIALKFIPKIPFGNTYELVPVMDAHGTGDKPLTEPMLTLIYDAIRRLLGAASLRIWIAVIVPAITATWYIKQ